MRKSLILAIMLLLASTTVAFTQVKEVKGVVCSIVCYENCEKQSDSEKTYGFEYENLNRFAIIVEAEKWRNALGLPAGLPECIVETKVFLIKPGEKYIWKVNMSGEIGGEISSTLGRVPLAKGAFYTKFKAFKHK
ncbi:MAG: hypothetical protein LBK58_12825 [Prevotellaceae bacterium]|jgi:hypothetical protein|nr:hypothetical protein [Prevotellaceae bacterium]